MRAIWLFTSLFVFALTASSLDVDFVSNFSIQEHPQKSTASQHLLSKRKEADPARQIYLQFDALQKRFVLDLELFEDLLAEEATVRYHWSRNKTMADEPMRGHAYVGRKLFVIDTPDDLPKNQTFISEIANYTGGASVENEPFARFFLQNGLKDHVSIQGTFTFKDKMFQVGRPDHPLRATHYNSLLQRSNRKKEESHDSLIITVQDENQSLSFGQGQSSNNQTIHYRCGHDLLPFNTNPQGAVKYFAQLLNKGSSALKNHLFERAEKGCPSSKKVVHLGIVADCAYLRAFDGDKGKAQANIINDFNVVSGIYEKYFNVILGIISIDLFPDCSSMQSETPWNAPCASSRALDVRLGQFSKWRDGQSGDAGLYHLVSGCIDSDVVGIAWLNQICRIKSFRSSNKDIVSGTSVSVLIPNQFAVIAHEIGHNFGAVHDCDAAACKACNGDECQCCPCGQCDCQGKYVMNPESGGLNVKDFSPCTQKDVCDKISILASCLKQPGSKQLIKGSVCGNGIKEEGEECDCGTAAECRSDPCCTKDCKLKPNSQCSDKNDVCCKECNFIPSTAKQTCRKAEGLCQLDTLCSGKSGECPTAEIVPDGARCEYNDGECASGVCTSRDRQCAAVGARLGISKACPSQPNSCSIVCQTLAGCVFLDATFIDGTPCGEKGRCKAGVCSESEFVGFFLRNTALVISLGVFFGVFLAAIFIRYLIFCCSRKNQQSSTNPPSEHATMNYPGQCTDPRFQYMNSDYNRRQPPLY